MTKRLKTLVGLDGFKMKDSNFKNEHKLLQLQSCMLLLKRLGVSASQLFRWAELGESAEETEDKSKSIAQDISEEIKKGSEG